MKTLSRFVTKFTNLIVAVLSCFDRVIFKGGAEEATHFLAQRKRGWPLRLPEAWSVERGACMLISPRLHSLTTGYCSENKPCSANKHPLPGEGGTGAAALEDDQYNERHYSTIVFSSFRVPQGGIRD